MIAVKQAYQKKFYDKVQYSRVKRKINGRVEYVSAPLLNLQPGEYKINFTGGSMGPVAAMVSVWCSSQGWAWQVTKIVPLDDF